MGGFAGGDRDGSANATSRRGEIDIRVKRPKSVRAGRGRTDLLLDGAAAGHVTARDPRRGGARAAREVKKGGASGHGRRPVCARE